jgi:Erv1 / Alr family
MVQASIWGPPIWKLFHVLIEKVKDEQFQILHMELFQLIKRICSYLPCPDCSQHATLFLNKVKPNQISNKNDFKNMLYVFHNQVNARKRKPSFPYSEMEKYKQCNIVHVYNKFISVYNTKGNMKMLTESFQRQFIIQDFKKWVLKNIQAFQ